MEIDQITEDFVEHCLRAWQQNQDLPTGVASLHLCLAAPNSSAVEMSFRLYDLFSGWVQQELNHNRTKHLLFSAGQWKEKVTADFCQGDMDLEAWSALYHRYFYPGGLPLDELIAASGMVDRQFRRRVSKGIERLTWRLRQEEQATHEKLHSVFLSRYLPQPEAFSVVGIHDLVSSVADALAAPDGPAYFSLEGVGGIGKTTIALAVARQAALARSFEGIAWISAKHEVFLPSGEIRQLEQGVRSTEEIVTRLAEQLGFDRLAGLSLAQKLECLAPVLYDSNNLVVIDNLETLPDVEYLLPAMASFQGKSRFLFTSRLSLGNFAQVKVIPVPELSFADSFTLVSGEINRRGRFDLRETLSEPSMRCVYQAIGGLPLALKLVASQLTHFPLEDVINGLAHPSDEANPSERLYRYIYWRTWQLLDAPARQLLVSAVLIPAEGETAAWLRQTSGLSPADFQAALAQLVDTALIDVSGPMEQPVYRFHRLTITFLQSEVLHLWDA